MGFLENLGGTVGGIFSWDANERDRQAQRDAYEAMMNSQRSAENAAKRENIIGRSAFEGISTDPALRAAQMRAINSMSQLADSNGLDPQSLAMMAESERAAAGQEQAQRQAIQQNMQARGMGGSGAEVAGLLAAQQGGANRSAQGARESAAQARMRALDAMGRMYDMSSGVRGQDWGENAAKAGAVDSWQRFNANQKDKALDRVLQANAQRQGATAGYNSFLNDAQAKKTSYNTGMWKDFGGFGDSIIGAAGDFDVGF